MNSKNEYDLKSINSPFRWAGGKFYARKIIEKYIPKHDFYVEPSERDFWGFFYFFLI